MKEYHRYLIWPALIVTVAILHVTCSAAGNVSSDNLYSLEGRSFFYDTIASLDQNYTVEDCSVL